MTDTPCWTCDHNQLGGETFFGFCTKPAKNNPTGKKEIPAHVADKGCKGWTLRQKQAAEEKPEESKEK